MKPYKAFRYLAPPPLHLQLQHDGQSVIGLKQIEDSEPIGRHNNIKPIAVLIKWGNCATEVSKMTNAKSEIEIEITKVKSRKLLHKVDLTV